MPQFLAETYFPRGGAGAALAAGQPGQLGAPVRLLSAVAVPEEETCFWLYQAPSAAAVRAAMTRAGLRPDRITPAISISPPRACLGPAPSTGTTAPPPAPAPGPQDNSSRPPHRTCPPAAGTGPP